jgi:hypothetical protein
MFVADIDPGSRSETDQAVNAPLPVVYLARHGETAWSLSGQQDWHRKLENTLC